MTILNKVEDYITSQLTTNLSSEYIYHNLGHTRRVVKFVKQLVEFEKIGPKDTQVLELAAWFHDSGFLKSAENHEQHSAEIAEEFLMQEKVAESTIKKVKDLILVTTRTNAPKTLLEKIILDADCAHVGSKSYIESSELLREEWAQLNLKTFTNIEWTQENIDFLTKRHHFYTEYAIENWQPRKDKNLLELYNLTRKKDGDNKKLQLKKEELKLKKEKAKTPERGIETMFRTTLRNHITLSNIADTKANILLSVNAIIISLALSNLIPKLDNPSNEYLIIPTVIFVVFSLISMALSVIATRPNVTSGKFTKEDVAQKKVNLLFFGNFHKVKLEDFEWAMGEMMKDGDYLYSSMTKDLYYLGLVLHKKYKILRITYTIFLVGVIVSVTAFAVAFKSLSL
ncbi:Pycsar system effector family protein [Urechidicola croceus]|uniref:Phosphohydrolase n=1 Tax=Urechidicola croceus TaxID=1850246 RepID=A0A1D8P7U7_9FLAO|nr:Pycsar system effector family protein [Urechidicola croceus]AOW20653.1 phosphohydrolase [Urechidicola croceus]